MKFKYQAFKKTVFAALFLMLNLAFSFKGNAQNISDFIFEKYSIKNGLSQSSSICLFQDKLGYIWVGTQQGIDRFDGYTFKQYSHDIKNDFSRSAGWVIDIQEDEKGNIWTSDTYGNISLLNKINDRWENIILPIRDSLFKINNKLPARLGVGASIYFDSKNNSLWIGSNGTGLIEYKIQSKKFKQYLVHPNDPIKFGKQEVVNKVVGFNENKLLVSTDIGLQYFDIQNHKLDFVPFRTTPVFNFSILPIKNKINAKGLGSPNRSCHYGY